MKARVTDTPDSRDLDGGSIGRADAEGLLNRQLKSRHFQLVKRKIRWDRCLTDNAR